MTILKSKTCLRYWKKTRMRHLRMQNMMTQITNESCLVCYKPTSLTSFDLKLKWNMQKNWSICSVFNTKFPLQRRMNWSQNWQRVMNMIPKNIKSEFLKLYSERHESELRNMKGSLWSWSLWHPSLNLKKILWTYYYWISQRIKKFD